MAKAREVLFPTLFVCLSALCSINIVGIQAFTFAPGNSYEMLMKSEEIDIYQFENFQHMRIFLEKVPEMCEKE